MNKKAIITILLALVTMAGLAQTKTAIIKGYSPMLKNGTEAVCTIDMVRVATDTVHAGNFILNVPVEKLTECKFYLEGEGCPNFIKTIFIAPNAVINMTGEDCMYPMWKVESTLPEQVTANRIMEHTRDAIINLLRMGTNSDYMEYVKKTLEIIPSLPVDAASLAELRDASRSANNIKDFAYMELLKEVEASVSARAPKGFENELEYIHRLVYPLRIVQPGEEAVDADFFDMQGNTHHLAELRGRYILLDFWSLGCGPCRMAEHEMRWVRDVLQEQLEIVGINRDKLSAWQESDWSKKIVWKNWNDGKMAKGGIESLYCDSPAIPYYVLLSPDYHVVWKSVGYTPGMFLGMADAINGTKQDNSANLQLVIKKVETNPQGTSVSFRFYGQDKDRFLIASSCYLTANAKKYKVIVADGITLDAETSPQQKASDSSEGIMSVLHFTDFTLTFEPFDVMPSTFDFKEGDDEGACVIHNISLE